MTLGERLRALLAVMPTDGSIILTAVTLAEWLAEDASASVGADLTVEQVAELMGKSCNSVRRWLLEGRLEGYRPGGRDWRVTPAALAEFRATPTATPSAVNLGAWRNVTRGGRHA